MTQIVKYVMLSIALVGCNSDRESNNTCKPEKTDYQLLTGRWNIETISGGMLQQYIDTAYVKFDEKGMITSNIPYALFNGTHYKADTVDCKPGIVVYMTHDDRLNKNDSSDVPQAEYSVIINKLDSSELILTSITEGKSVIKFSRLR